MALCSKITFARRAVLHVTMRIIYNDLLSFCCVLVFTNCLGKPHNTEGNTQGAMYFPLLNITCCKPDQMGVLQELCMLAVVGIITPIL